MNTYTITIFHDRHERVLPRLLGVFSRRHVDIEALSVHRCHGDDRCLITVIVNTNNRSARQIASQLEKYVGVLKVTCCNYDSNDTSPKF